MTNPANFLPVGVDDYMDDTPPPKCLGVKVDMNHDPYCGYGGYVSKITIREEGDIEEVTFNCSVFDGSWDDMDIKVYVEAYYGAPITAPYEIVRPAAKVPQRP